jgi:hypothetical protein
MYKYFVILLAGILFLSCKSSPSGIVDNQEIEEEEIINDGTGEPEEPIVISLEEPEETFGPLERVVYVYDELESLIGENLFNEENQGVQNIKLDVILESDTLQAVVWDWLPSEIETFNDSQNDYYAITIPLLLDGEYPFFIELNDQYIIEGTFTVFNDDVILDPISYVNESVSMLTDSVNYLVNELQSSINSSLYESAPTEEIEKTRSDFQELDSLMIRFNEQISSASDKEIESFAYFFRNFESLLHKNSVNGKLLLKGDLERDLGYAFEQVKRSNSTVNINRTVSEYGVESLSEFEEEEGSLWDTFTSLYTKYSVSDLINNLWKSMQKTYLALEKFEFKEDYERNKFMPTANNQVRTGQIDTIRVESGFPEYFSIDTDYVNVLDYYFNINGIRDEFAPTNNEIINQDGTGLLADLLQSISNFGVLRSLPFWGALDVLTQDIPHDYLDFEVLNEQGVVTISEVENSDSFKIETTHDSYSELVTDYSVTYNFSGTNIGNLSISSSNCPNFRSFLTGQWETTSWAWLTDDSDGQQERYTVKPNGKLTENYYRVSPDREWKETGYGGSWWIVCNEESVDLHFSSYRFEYKKDRTTLYGERKGGVPYPTTLRKGWHE